MPDIQKTIGDIGKDSFMAQMRFASRLAKEVKSGMHHKTAEMLADIHWNLLVEGYQKPEVAA